MLIFFFNDTATTEIYTLSLHDALPISPGLIATVNFPSSTNLNPCGIAFIACSSRSARMRPACSGPRSNVAWANAEVKVRSEEHTSELQSRQYLVCRLLLEKKKVYTFDK